MKTLALLAGAFAVGLIVAQRLVPLAPTRLGWVFYLANIVGEFAPKRLKVRRAPLELGTALLGLALLAVGGMPPVGVVCVAAAMLAQVAIIQRAERRLLDAVWVEEDRIGPRPKDPARAMGLAEGYPEPSTHPRLTLTLVGPFVRRRPELSVGTLAVGRKFRVRLLLGNHALTPTQTAVRVRVAPPPSLGFTGEPERVVPAVFPGEVRAVDLDFEAVTSCGGTRIPVEVRWGETVWNRTVRIEAIAASPPAVLGAEIRRYPGARRSAFAWRGDMDQYDTSTLQSIEGLESTFGMAARYRVPQTMYLSTRLSLDEGEARQWASHFGVERGADRIPDFVEWMRANVDLQHRAEYPFESQKPYLIELGNHGHLHYGTDTSAAEQNGWNIRSRMGAGVYPWTRGASSSLEEQRENALEARRRCERAFGFSPKSWAMPDRTNDASTPAAMEAAGCEVLSDSDVKTVHNVLLQPPPHFARGSGAVELTKRYPGDPLHYLHYGMNLFWVHRAVRLGIPVIFMGHQHLRLYEGWTCTRLTEAILREVLEGFGGDLWISTVYGIGVYWRDVLSPERTVTVRVEGGRVRVRNGSGNRYDGVPVDLDLGGGRSATVLVDLGPGAEVELDASGAAP